MVNLTDIATEKVKAFLDSEGAAGLLRAFGLLGGAAAGDEAASADGALPDRLAPVLALVGALPPQLTERLLVELLARVVEPAAGS